MPIEDAEALGERFLTAAKALWDAERGRPSIANLQALHIMHLRLVTNCNHGFYLLHFEAKL
jgi:hypothetical protein